jgi:peptidoglycan/LPS O-acetylase OafA/YrhL
MHGSIFVAGYAEKNDTIKSIQILRAIAALSVVYSHCTSGGDYKFPSMGGFGVDIFFIISGFIIGYIVSRNTEHFMVKRIIRIVPLYYIATLLMTFTVLLLPHFIHSTTVSVSGFIKSILFIPGPENRGFPILGQGWTLNFEMFFYLITFLCILAVKNEKYIIITCVSVLTIFVIVLNIIKPNIYLLNRYQTGLFPEFIYGLLLYCGYGYYGKKHTSNISNKMNGKVILKIVALIGLAVISYAYLVFRDVYHFTIFHNRNIAVGIPAFVLVSALLLLENTIGDNKFVRIGIKLGEASYAMYLFHYHIVTFFSRIAFPKIFGDTHGGGMEVVKLIVAILLTAIISVLIYELVDNPIQKHLRKMLKKYNGRKNN